MSRIHLGYFTAALALLGSLVLVGCVGTPKPSERAARADLRAVEARFRPSVTNAMPALTAQSSLEDLLNYAMLNRPQVAAAYLDWAASVERITVERSLPDPQLTFQMDLQSVVTSLMPGLMMEFPGPGKLAARADLASAESSTKYFAFENAVLQAAFDVKKAYYQLHFIEDKIRINRGMSNLVEGLEEIARQQNDVGKGTLQDVLRAQIEQDQIANDLANLTDSRNPLLAQLKGALGLSGAAPAPPVPLRFETTPLDLSSDQIFATALLRNPRLRAMEAEVRLAQAGIAVAEKSRVPDYAVGVEADAQATPAMVRPRGGMTLPIWRDKIAAEIASAQNRKSAAEARFSAEQIAMAVDFADKLFSFRENTRTITLIEERVLPKARMSLEVARAAYLSSKTDFLNLIDAQRALLGFELTAVEARLQRELVLAEISLLVLGLPPAQAPLLNADPDPIQLPNRSVVTSHE